jgi:predicted PurR-regulated permease PerM
VPDDKDDDHARTTGTLIVAFVASCFALYFGREFFVPIVFAFLLNAVFRPPVRAMEAMRVPAPAGAAVVVLALIAAFLALGYALAGPISNGVAKAPEHFAAAQTKLEKIREPVQKVSAAADQLQHVADGPTTAPSAASAPAPASGPGLLAEALGTTTRFAGAVVGVLLLLYLLLASGDLFFQKLVKVMPRWRDKKAAVETVNDVQSVVMRYLLVTLFINLGQAAIVALVLWLLHMPNPLLWGALTVLLEFIPYLGATIMIALLTIVAFATFDSLGHILLVPGSYLLVTTLQNNVVSPIAYGKRLKLNPVAVLVGVLFWWFLWGIPGAFLAVPIVATIKIVADRTERFAAVGEFLGE